MKGQGSAEYLVLFAMVLVVALIAVVLIGGLPFGNSKVMDSESLSYWSSSRPFGITEWAQKGSTLYITLQNNDQRRLILQNITVGSLNFGTSPGWAFGAGSHKNISIPGVPACNVTTYDSFAYNIIIYYDSVDISNQRQIGLKPLTGGCSFS